jgi:hypothetical protein
MTAWRWAACLAAGAALLGACTARDTRTVTRVRTDVLVAAAGAFAKQLPGGDVVLDAVSLEVPGQSTIERDSAESRRIADAFGIARVARNGKHLRCTLSWGRGRQCRIEGADALVSVSQPELRDDGAVVMIRVAVPARAGAFPMHEEDHVVRLRASGGGWVATSIRLSRQT